MSFGFFPPLLMDKQHDSPGMMTHPSCCERIRVQVLELPRGPFEDLLPQAHAIRVSFEDVVAEPMMAFTVSVSTAQELRDTLDKALACCHHLAGDPS